MDRDSTALKINVMLIIIRIPLNSPVRIPPMDCLILSLESTAFLATAIMENIKHSRMPIRAMPQ